jgi:hypothetical protein
MKEQLNSLMIKYGYELEKSDIDFLLTVVEYSKIFKDHIIYFYFEFRIDNTILDLMVSHYPIIDHEIICSKCKISHFSECNLEKVEKLLKSKNRDHIIDEILS